jgi:hypothetical protein
MVFFIKYYTQFNVLFAARHDDLMAFLIQLTYSGIQASRLSAGALRPAFSKKADYGGTNHFGETISSSFGRIRPKKISPRYTKEIAMATPTGTHREQDVEHCLLVPAEAFSGGGTRF